MQNPPDYIAAANALTARWCEVAGTAEFVVSGAGIWPLLGMLAGAAEGPARAELQEALGFPAELGHGAALRVLALLAESVDMSAALGVWVREDVSLRERWRESVPEGVAGTLTDQRALDEWANRHTDGRIPAFPLRITPSTLMVLATALAAKTRWRTPFQHDTLAPTEGPWAGRRLVGIGRSVTEVDEVAVLGGGEPVTRVVVTGRADIDVHLLLGSGDPGAVLGTGLRALRERLPVVAGTAITEGPGLTRREIDGPMQVDTLRIVLPPFTIRSEHDLLARPGLFGLRAATDSSRGHFPGLSDTALAVDQGAQDVLAIFDRVGFEAAAVTALSMEPGGAPPPLPAERRTLRIEVDFDRPFGFLLVHRASGLAVVAGWMTDPADQPEPSALPQPASTPTDR